MTALLAHTPARRPITGENPTIAHARTHATAHLAAGNRDARRALSEALAAAQQAADYELTARLRFLMDVALRPGLTQEDVLFECRVLLEFGGAGLVGSDVAARMCSAMLEGWAMRQQLATGGAW